MKVSSKPVESFFRDIFADTDRHTDRQTAIRNIPPRGGGGRNGEGALKMTDMKTQDMSMTDQVAGHEVAGQKIQC